MKLGVMLVLIVSLATSARAQMSDAQIKAGLAELNAKAAREHAEGISPATRPATIAAAKPAVPPRLRWIAKPGAPQAVCDWVADQDQHRLDAIQAKQEEIDKAKRDLASPSENGNYDALRAKVGNLIREKRRMEGDTFAHIPRGTLKWELGSCGGLDKCHVIQVIDEHDCIIRPEWVPEILSDGYKLWIKGFSMRGVVDDDVIEPGNLMITGTQTYTTAAGGSSTLYIAEPIDLKKWAVLEPVATSQPAAGAAMN